MDLAFSRPLEASDFILAGSVFVILCITGIILTLLVLPPVFRRLDRGKHRVGTLLASSLRWLLVPVFFISGLRAGLNLLHLEGEAWNLAQKALDLLYLTIFIIFLARLTGDLLVMLSQGESEKQRLRSSTILVNVLRVLVLTLGVIVGLGTLGVEVGPILTALGVGGLAVALALQSTLGNLFSGLQLIASKRLKPGDYIILENGTEGQIIDINWRSTALLLLSHNTLIIPNNKMAEAMIINTSSPSADGSCVLELEVAYDSDLDRVEACCREAAARVSGASGLCVQEFEPLVMWYRFAESGIGLRVIVRVIHHSQQNPVKSLLIREITLAFRANGIQIPYPVRTIEVRQTLARGAVDPR